MFFSYNLLNWGAITDSVRDCQPGSTFLYLSKIVRWAFDISIWKIIVQKVRIGWTYCYCWWQMSLRKESHLAILPENELYRDGRSVWILDTVWYRTWVLSRLSFETNSMVFFVVLVENWNWKKIFSSGCFLKGHRFERNEDRVTVHW